MATRDDFITLAAMLHVLLSAESQRFTRSLERGGELNGDHVVSGRVGADIPYQVWLLASNRVVETQGIGPRLTRTVTDERCQTERFYASYRPNGIKSHFAQWPEGSSFARCCWLLEI